MLTDLGGADTQKICIDVREPCKICAAVRARWDGFAAELGVPQAAAVVQVVASCLCNRCLHGDVSVVGGKVGKL